MTAGPSKLPVDTLELTGEIHQVIDGFGGCFNELGWSTLLTLDGEHREEVLAELFDPKGGCRFNLCRLPVGANDYALEWYSHDEYDGDYGMERFSIERDRRYIIPYIKSAMAYRPDLSLFASPWSPPIWMKSPRAYNYGTLVWEKKNLQAYARYFSEFVQAYQAEGIRIHQVHVQNEPMSDQKFPSCLWTGEQFREFIREYLGPQFERDGLDTEIWLGTLNGPEVDERFLRTGYDQYANLVLSDPEARKYIRGVSYQWCGKNAVQQTYLSWPEMKLMQSENECGDGQNTWEYARYVFNLFRHYFMNGVGSYIYWNMVLPPGGRSTWGWRQNSLITVDPSTQEVVYNPEYYVMKHYSHFIQKGARRLGIKGHWAGSSVVFENPDGQLVLVVGNGLPHQRGMRFRAKGCEIDLELKAYSINTVLI
ncbi:MAG TPA: glycosyl hydrolase [Bacillota bacterium]|nr:glycosyl hydrolase [Bacillota bacterium]